MIIVCLQLSINVKHVKLENKLTKSQSHMPWCGQQEGKEWTLITHENEPMHIHNNRPNGPL